MTFDFKSPDYSAVHAQRLKRLQKIRSDPSLVPALKTYYKHHIAEFINDWASTVDPRVIADGRSPFMPFLLFPKQIDLVNWIIDHWKGSKPGVVVKSRDVGASWIAMAVSCSLCIFYRDMMIGVGSAKEVKIDRSGDPDTIFYKARNFMQFIPREFRGGWEIERHSPHMRLIVPETGSSITGEAGDSIGRGGRKAIYFVDEAAHVERPQLVDAALSSTTNCRIDMSSVAGMANSFAEKAHNGKIDRFDFSWRDDPRKDDAWYRKYSDEHDSITVAQEVDCNFSASSVGVIIPSIWVQAAVNADQKLGLAITGKRHGALDVADEGRDKNAFAVRHGNLLLSVESWSGKDSDIMATTNRAFDLADEWQVPSFVYDNDGLGAGVKGDAKAINTTRAAKGWKRVTVEGFRGSGAVVDPEKQMVPGRKNEDFFANAKAQAWWHLRFMFQETWRASQGLKYNPDLVISIRSGSKEFSRLLVELSQPVYLKNTQGKILVDKQPDGVASPNLADAVMMVFAPRRLALSISDDVLERASMRG